MNNSQNSKAGYRLQTVNDIYVFGKNFGQFGNFVVGSSLTDFTPF